MVPLMTVFGTLASLLERPLVLRDTMRRLDAIVVLGAPLWPGDRLTPILEERIEAAVALWRDGGAPIVVATGGITNDATRAEADVMADALREHGVPEVLVENQSKTTADNARRTAALLQQLGVRSVWLVTQPFHGRRAARLFRAAGLEAHVWHIDSSIEYRDRRRAVRWLLREYAAWGALLVRRQR